MIEKPKHNNTGKTTAIEKLLSGMDTAFKTVLKEDDYRTLQRIAALTVHQCNAKFRPARILQIAKIVVTEMGLGRTSLLCVFIFDWLDCSGVKLSGLEKEIAPKQFKIINGMVKVSHLHKISKGIQTVNYRKLLLSFAEDIRVILIAMAFLLFELRRIKSLGVKRQNDIIRKINYLYLPFAHKLGLYNIKLEMEDKILLYNEPEIFNTIQQKLNKTSRKRSAYIRKFLVPIKMILTNEKFDYELKWRTKSVSSILNKMRETEVEFEDIYDIFAIRIILKSLPEKEKSDCWQVYSIISDIYRPNPQRLRDWITIPKSNGYESLQTTVLGPENKWVEVQIRTGRMDEIAEKGYAAHWHYKGRKGDKIMNEWIQNFREILEMAAKQSVEMLDEIKVEFSEEEIYVFTPVGDIKQLPVGATLLDFAYAVHSDLGNKCTGGLVNQKNVSLRHKLINGDQIVVYTSKNQKPNMDWLNIVVTSKAKTKIRQSLNEEIKKLAEIGKETLLRRLRNWKIEFNDAAVRKMLKHFKYKLAQDFYAGVATEKHDMNEVKSVLIQKEIDVPEVLKTDEKSGKKRKTAEKGEDVLLIAGKVANLNYKFSSCCNPVMGDPIFGFITIADGIKIHRKNCPNAIDMQTRYPYRVVKTIWKAKGSRSYLVKLQITGKDEMGIANKISDVVSNKFQLQMRSYSINSEPGGNFNGTLEILVHNASHLDMIMNRLLKLKGIKKVSRFERN